MQTFQRLCFHALRYRIAGSTQCQAVAANPRSEVRLGSPVLEASLDHLHVEVGEVAPGGSGELGAELAAGDPKPTLSQREGCLAGGTADLREMLAGSQAGRGDQLLEQVVRVVGRARWYSSAARPKVTRSRSRSASAPSRA